MPYSSQAVANKFIELADQQGERLTNMQLQKLVFIAHGYMLGIFDRKLYHHNTHAWQWGPVVPKLYKALQMYGRDHVTEQLAAEDEIPDEGEESTIIKAVWESYGHLTGGQLSRLTHRENTPWSVTWEDDKFGVIPESLIAEHYKELMASS